MGKIIFVAFTCFILWHVLMLPASGVDLGTIKRADRGDFADNR